MSSIFGKSPSPHQPSGQGSDAAPLAPPQQKAAAKPAPRPAQDALASGGKRPPMAAHAQSDLVVPRSPESPAPKSPQARRTQTEPASASDKSAALLQDKPLRIEAFAAVSAPYAQLTPNGRALAADLFALTGHPEGLKTYFFVHPGLSPIVASHTAVDVEVYRERPQLRSRAATGQPAGPFAAAGGDASAISSHKHMSASVANAAKGVTRPAAGPLAPKDKWFTLQQTIMLSGQRGAEKLATVGPNGERMVQGGIRMCRPANANYVTLGPSVQFAYLDGGPENTAALAAFCANVLLAQAAASRTAPLRAQPLEQTHNHGKIDADEMNAGLRQLCQEINARLDAAAA